jgi:acyl carrier protein
MAIEEEFGIEVPDSDAENIRTLGDILTYIEARVETAA